MADRSVFQPQVEAHVPQTYEDTSECELLHKVDHLDKGEDINPTRRDVHNYGDECFLLEGLFSQAEVKYYIDSGEQIGFGAIQGATPSYRNCERIMVQSQSLADALWNRVQLFLSEMNIEGDPHDVHIHGVKSLIQGRWKPCGINHIFRLCKYAPGGHFAPHFDGHLVKSPEVRSMKTLMLYLNNDFDGGTTNFIDESQELYKDSLGRYCAEEKNIVCRVKPEPGLAIIFNHHRLHEGQAVENGEKYILRTEIMYQREDGHVVDESQTQALLLIQEAERLEGHGDCMKAMELYRKAFKMSPSLADYYNNK